MLVKIKEHFIEFIIMICLFGGLLYAVVTTHKISVELGFIKEQLQEQKRENKAIRGALYLVMSKTEGITEEHIKDFVALSTKKGHLKDSLEQYFFSLLPHSSYDATTQAGHR
jgi:hypothetical protein